MTDFKLQIFWYPAEESFGPRVLSNGIWLHRFRLRTLRLYHVRFCLQSQQYIVQKENYKNGHSHT